MTTSSHIPSTVNAWLQQLAPGRSGPVIAVIDPGSGETLADVVDSSPADVDTAVRRARRAFDDGRWSELDADVRERVMLHLAELVDRDAEMLATIEALDTGKPLVEAALDIDEVAAVLRYYAGWCTKISGATIAAPRRFAASTIRKPIGVCAAITPWNYPLPILVYKLAPALAAGNTFVAKPSELAPLSSIHLARLCTEAGVPDDVVTILTGGPAAGAALAASPLIDKLAFTGSSATGRAVMRAAAERPVPVTLELGGKSPHLVFASADLDTAARSVCAGIWTNAGQVCVAGSRLLVEASCAGELLDRIVDLTRAIRLGHSLDPTSEMGPMITERQRARAARLVDAATADGARALTGARAIDGPGHFFQPTVLTDVPAGHPVVMEEIFGPVLVVDTFTTEDEAIAKANSTPYGLAAGISTGQAGQAQRLARRLSAGTVWVNTYGVFHPTLPFGGTKSSGFGRELGPAAIDAYTSTTTVVEDVYTHEEAGV